MLASLGVNAAYKNLNELFNQYSTLVSCVEFAACKL
jgi:hypothetical protein